MQVKRDGEKDASFVRGGKQAMFAQENVSWDSRFQCFVDGINFVFLH